MYVLPHEPTSWVASNALPLELELLPFLVTRTGRHLIELLTWLLDIRPELCKELIEVVPMSAAEYEAYEEQVEAITEEEHQRLLTEFLTRMATKRGILDAARAAGELAGQRQSVLDVLALRGLTLTEPERARILAEADPERLRRWLARAVAVDTAAQVFADE